MRRYRAFSMVELMTALAVMTILLGAITSVLLLAARAAGQTDTPTARATMAAEAISTLSADLHLALVFVHTGTHAVEFTVPDRDGDDEAELIRYEWSDDGGNLGIAGAPLKRQINGGAWAVVVEDVHQLDLTYLLKTWGPPPPPPEVESGEIVLAEHDDDPGGASVGARDAARILLIQSWAYDVTSIDSGTSQAALDTAAAAHDVAYLPAGLSDQVLGNKLRQVDIGVVSESRPLAGEMGLTDLPVLPVSKEKIKIHRDDHPHWITDAWDNGDRKLADFDLALNGYPGIGGVGVTSAAKHTDNPKDPALVAVDPGSPLKSGGGNAPDRRVFLPWGSSDFDIADLNSDGQTMMQRSIAWAANHVAAARLLYVVDGLGSGIDRLDLIQDHGPGQYFPPPTLPTNTLGWTITRVEVRLQSHGPDLGGEIDVSLVIPDAQKKPTSLVLWTQRIKEDELPAEMAWVPLTVSGLSGLDPAEGLCLSIVARKQKDEKKDGLTEFEANPSFAAGGFFWSETVDKALTWSAPVQDKRLRLRVFGTYTTAGPPVWD